MTKLIMIVAGALSFVVAVVALRPSTEEPVPTRVESISVDRPDTSQPAPMPTVRETGSQHRQTRVEDDVPRGSTEAAAATVEFAFPEPGERVLAYGMDLVSSGGPDDWAPWLQEDEEDVRAERDGQPALEERAPLPVPDTAELYELAPELARESNEAEDLTLQELLEDPDFEPVVPGSTTPSRRPFFVPAEDME